MGLEDFESKVKMRREPRATAPDAASGFLLLLFDEEKRDANFFGLTAPIEILSQSELMIGVRHSY